MIHALGLIAHVMCAVAEPLPRHSSRKDRLMTATPLHDAAWCAVVVREAFADLRLAVGLDQPAPTPAPRAYRRKAATSPTRLAILHESALLYAVSAA